MEKPGWINDLFRSRWERQGWIQLRKGDFQAGDDEGSETWQWVGWNIKLAWQTNILNGRANAKLWNFRISKHATIINATTLFFILSNDVAWCSTQDWHGVASSCYKQGVRCNKASNSAPSVLSNIVSCCSTHLCDTRMEHVKRLRQDLRGGWEKEKKGEE